MAHRIERAAIDIDLLRRQLPDLERKLAEYSSSGFTTSKGDQVGGGSTPGISSSPVERAAATPDPAAAMRDRIVRRVVDLSAALDDLTAWFAWALKVEQEGGDTTAPGCSIMAMVNVWEPATMTNAGGNLIEKRLLGLWARRFVLRHGRLPTKAEAERRAQGSKVHAAS